MTARDTRFEWIYMPDDPSAVNTQASKAQDGFLTLVQNAFDSVASQSSMASLSYRDYMLGCTVIAALAINTCNGGMRTGPGFLDVELVFKHNPNRPQMDLVCFAEYDQTITLDSALVPSLVD